MWNEKLAECGKVYSSAVLTVVEESDYPVSVRCKPAFNAARKEITFEELSPLAEGWRGSACLLLHRHNDVLEDFYELVIRGELSDEGAVLIFRPTDFVTGSGRQDTDRMPHAGAPLHLIQFMMLGRRKAREYIAKRGKPWPPINFDILTQATQDVETGRK